MFLSLRVNTNSRKFKENITRATNRPLYSYMARFRIQPKARRPRATLSSAERKSITAAQAKARNSITADIVEFQEQIAEAAYTIACKHGKTPSSILQRLHAGSCRTLVKKGKPNYTAWHAYCSYETKASNNGAKFSFELSFTVTIDG